MKLELFSILKAMSTPYYKWIERNYKNKHYIQGRNFEYAVMRKLRKLGYYCARKFGSIGHEDVVACRNQTVLFIQCKHSKVRDTKPDQFDLKGLIQLAKTYGALAVFAGVKNHHMYFQCYKKGRWMNVQLD